MYSESPKFHDRTEAGKQLAEKLSEYEGTEAVVFAIPRGGVPVATAVVLALKLRLDLVISKKIPIPDNPEAGYGAVTEDGVIVLNEGLVAGFNLSKSQIRRQAEEVRAEIERRSSVFHSRLPRLDIRNKTAIIVDDGLASGYTMMAAVVSLKRRQPGKIIVAVPVASGNAFDLVRPAVQDIVALIISREPEFAVAEFYYAWRDLTDADVLKSIAGYLSKTEKSRAD